MTILLSIAATLSGLVVVGPLVSYIVSEILLRRTLSSRAALLEFWNRRFKDSRGVMGLLLSENPDWPKPEYQLCMGVIRVEYMSFKKLRRHAFIVFVLFTALWFWISSRFSYWILFWFLASTLISAAGNRERGRDEALLNIFRATRLWMWVSPASLAENSRALHIAGVADLLLEVETTQNPADHPPGCLCETCLAIFED